MRAAAFLTNLDVYKDRSVFFIAGTEPYVADACAEGLLRALPIQNQVWNLRVFRGKVTGEDLQTACMQAPLFSPVCAVYLDNIDVSEAALHFLDILKTLPAETKLLIKWLKKPDMRQNVYQLLFHQAVTVEAEAPKGKALVSWVVSMARRAGIVLDAALAGLILEISGEDMYTVKNEIGKLSQLRLQTPSRQDIEALFSATTEYDAFSFHTDMLAGRFTSAFRTFDKLQRNRDALNRFIGLMVSKFSPMYLARLCLDAGLSGQAAITRLVEKAGIKNYPAKLAVRDCRRFTRRQLEDALRLLEEMDCAVKTGKAFMGFRAAFLKLYAAV